MIPQVTVIIAAYNSSKTLYCALRSLCRQTFQDFEAWVVGDACTDDSEEVVAGFADQRLNWTNLERHFGSQSWPNNEGLRRARGRYIAYLGHDDLWFPRHLAGLVTTIKETGADFVHAAAVLIDSSGPLGVLGAPGVRRSYAQRFVVPSSWLHRREVIDTCGNWPQPQGQVGGVDFVFQRRAFLAGHKFAPCGQLSVLKFPSPWWRTYALKRDHPQAAYLERMEDDAAQLHRQVLTDLLFTVTRPREEAFLSYGLALAKAAAKTRLLDWYGIDRWPLTQYLVWRGERGRKRTFTLRGLDNGKSLIDGVERKEDSPLIC